MQQYFSFLVCTNLTNAERLKFKAIIITDIHRRDSVDKFVQENVMDAKQFQWISQLRFYWLKEFDSLYIAHCSGREECKTNDV